jgi:lipopolysaccharide export system protein LptC
MAATEIPESGSFGGRTARRSIARQPGIGYSRFVAALKLLLPAIAIGLLLLIGVWPHLQAGLDRVRLMLPRIDRGEARDLRMVNARYTGVDREGRPYTVTADVARQPPRQSDLVSLEGPKADIALRNGTWIAVNADTGVYHAPKQMLDLSGAVTLYYDKGMELTTDSARVNLDAGTAEGHDKVAGHGVYGEIESEGFRVLGHGDDVIFTGHATLRLNGSSAEALR